ncbi:uncharacterized protein METZ01_LOCUS38871 [marine metagenome]|jgi:hypothetical protein|uniref:DUF1573 domain-containing protein n=1 Tax=marine metagenome TaxID=408172 RepID=A0A381R814_9ZZZZ|tara:strand:+ start:1538 stop:1975 length:438 start_codon:yes stop_codon:yes gene_type:complete
MKKLILLTILFSFLACNESASKKINTDVAQNQISKDRKYAEITFDRIFHDFGNVNEGEIAKTVFTFTNTSENDLYIVDARGSCGCTVPKYPKNVAIKPGETGEIEVNFDTTGRPNLQQKMVKVSANTSTGGEMLRIQAFVNPINK